MSESVEQEIRDLLAELPTPTQREGVSVGLMYSVSWNLFRSLENVVEDCAACGAERLRPELYEVLFGPLLNRIGRVDATNHHTYTRLSDDGRYVFCTVSARVPEDQADVLLAVGGDEILKFDLLDEGVELRPSGVITLGLSLYPLGPGPAREILEGLIAFAKRESA